MLQSLSSCFYLLSSLPLFFQTGSPAGLPAEKYFLFCLFLPSPLYAFCSQFTMCLSAALILPVSVQFSAPETKNCSSLLYFSFLSSSSSVTQSETFPLSARQSARIPIDQSPLSSHHPDHVFLSATHTLCVHTDTYYHTRRQKHTYSFIWLHRQTVIASPH